MAEPTLTEKRCSLCAELKPTAEFYSCASSKTGVASACKICSRNRDRRYRETYNALQHNPQSCGCGCGQVTTNGKMWIDGHHRNCYQETKFCTICKRARPISEFYMCIRRPRKGGVPFKAPASSCRECHSFMAKSRLLSSPVQQDAARARSVRWRSHNQEYRRAYWRQKTYGLEPAVFDSMAKEQGHKCAICKCAPKVLVVDHCHSSGKVRSLLCHHCNMYIGFMEQNPELTDAMLRYIHQHQTEPS